MKKFLILGVIFIMLGGCIWFGLFFFLPPSDGEVEERSISISTVSEEANMPSVETDNDSVDLGSILDGMLSEGKSEYALSEAEANARAVGYTLSSFHGLSVHQQ